MTTVNGYFTNTDPALNPQAVAALVGQEPALTLDFGTRTAERTRITRASAAAGVVRVTVDVPDGVHPLAADAAAEDGETVVGIRALERDGATIEAVDLWTSRPGEDAEHVVHAERNDDDSRPWAERVMRGRHRGAYATAFIEAGALADDQRRRVVVDRTKAEAERHWSGSFRGEPHDRYRLRIERVPGRPATFEINVALLPVGTSL